MRKRVGRGPSKRCADDGDRRAADLLQSREESAPERDLLPYRDDDRGDGERAGECRHGGHARSRRQQQHGRQREAADQSKAQPGGAQSEPLGRPAPRRQHQPRAAHHQRRHDRARNRGRKRPRPFEQQYVREENAGPNRGPCQQSAQVNRSGAEYTLKRSFRRKPTRVWLNSRASATARLDGAPTAASSGMPAAIDFCTIS